MAINVKNRVNHISPLQFDIIRKKYTAKKLGNSFSFQIKSKNIRFTNFRQKSTFVLASIIQTRSQKSKILSYICFSSDHVQ